MYRDHHYAARCRQQQISRESGVSTLPPLLIQLYARRQARTWSAAVGLLSFVAMIGHLAVTLREDTVPIYLMASWAAMGVTFLVVRAAAGHWLQRQIRRAYNTSGDLFFDLGRLEAERPLDFVTRRVHQLERHSLLLPLLAASLLTPLSIHLAVALGLLSVTLQAFGQWVVISLMLVGHAHLTLALFAVFHAVRLQHELDAGRHVVGAPRGLVALLWTVGASAIPGVVLLCVPPLLVALTGLLFVPWAFHWAGRRALAERRLLEAHGLVVAEPLRHAAAD